MKPVQFLGDVLKKLKSFPESVRVDAGRELRRMQEGRISKEDTENVDCRFERCETEM
jgi:phage-related protein